METRVWHCRSTFEKLDRNKTRQNTLKYSNMGYKVGDTIKYYRTSDEFREWHNRLDSLPLGSGVIEAIYPYFFLVRVGKYRIGVNKVDVWLREGMRVFNND